MMEREMPLFFIKYETSIPKAIDADMLYEGFEMEDKIIISDHKKKLPLVAQPNESIGKTLMKKMPSRVFSWLVF